MRIEYIDFEKAKSKIKNNLVVVFGAGDRGIRLVEQCLNRGFSVKAIWDNDVLKQGKKAHGVPIISYDELKLYNGEFSLFVGCNYIKQEASRIDDLNIGGGVISPYDRELLKEYYRNDLPDFERYKESVKEHDSYYNDGWSKETSALLVEDITNYSFNHAYDISYRTAENRHGFAF